MLGYIISSETRTTKNHTFYIENGGSTPGIEYLYNFKNYSCYHIQETNQPNIHNSHLPVVCIWKSNYFTLDLISEGKQYVQMIGLIQHRLKNNLPVGVIHDNSYESSYNRTAFEKLIKMFTEIGLDVKNQVLFLKQKDTEPYYNFSMPEYNIVEYNWPALDAYFWKNNSKHKFTDLSLSKRPNMINLLASKLIDKPWRAEVVYEFYKNNLLDKTILSIHGKTEDFYFTNDKAFIREIDTRITRIGGKLQQGDFGITNAEIGCQTSDRTIYNNSRISCILETMGPEQGDPTLNPKLTEKFYRSIVNYTPYIVIGHSKIYKTIKSWNFHTFDEFCNIENAYENNINVTQDAVKSIKTFLQNTPDNVEKIQELVNDNYKLFESIVKEDSKIYHGSITKFLITRIPVTSGI